LKTILVSGASGVVGYGILRSLRKADRGWRLVGTTIHEDSAAPGFCDVFELAPPTRDAGYVTWLKRAIESHSVDLIVPGIEEDVFRWTESAGELGQTGARAVLNVPELVALCRDKWAFFESIRASGLPCVIESSLEPDFDRLAERFGLPFLLKPRGGFGGRGQVTVSSRQDFLPHEAKVGPVLLAQPVVGTEDDELTTSAFADGRGGFQAHLTLRRRLSSEGFTDRAEVVQEDGDVVAAVRQLCALFRPEGPTNFQFRRHQGVPRLLEINPRVSSATSIRTAFGYNECAMAVDYYLDGRLPTQPAIRPGRAVRYLEDLVFYS
jgi:carbamoyl-phosphate synthase large subunit